jgi:antitoxin component HigA of HigAB toxin-antitoxin module
MSDPFSVQKDFDDGITRIRAMPDPIEKNNAAMKSFGRRWKDISQLFEKV